MADGGPGTDHPWREQLRAARERLGLSREELGELTGLSASSIRAYEAGRRIPRRESLEGILRVLRLERGESNPIREGVGFRRVRSLWEHESTYYFSLHDVDDEVERARWPEFVTNDTFEVVAANQACCALWGLDYQAERARREPFELNVVAVASEWNFPRVIENWDEIVRMIVRGFKDPALQDDPTQPSPYLARAVEHFMKGDPQLVPKLIDAWNSVTYEPARVRWHYPVVWNHPECGRMRFDAIVSTASEPDGLAFNDWIPEDAASWEALERVKATWGHVRGAASR